MCCFNLAPPPDCILTEWSNWTACDIRRGTQRQDRWRIAAVADDFNRLMCVNQSEHQFCVRSPDRMSISRFVLLFCYFCGERRQNNYSIAPGVTISPVNFEMDENATSPKTVDIMLMSPPNLTQDLSYNPYLVGEPHMVAEVEISHPRLIVFPKRTRFTVSSYVIFVVKLLIMISVIYFFMYQATILCSSTDGHIQAQCSYILLMIIYTKVEPTLLPQPSSFVFLILMLVIL